VRLDALVAELEYLSSRREHWMAAALDDARSGRADLWRARHDQVIQLIDRTAQLVRELGSVTEAAPLFEAVLVDGLPPTTPTQLAAFLTWVEATKTLSALDRVLTLAAMDRCRSAVPVWILPTYRIADQWRIQPDMFDVVVDEASQAGVEAAFLQYLAPRIVVIGNDKQVSP
jgi:hypothetical protein